MRYKISSSKLILFLALVSCFSTGCRRYTSSYTEIAGRNTATILSLDAKTFFEDKHRSESEVNALIKLRRRTANQINSSNYLVGVDDLIQVNVFDVEELSSTARVRADGLMNLPVIGDVKVVGRQVSYIEKQLMDIYSKYIQNPKLQVEVKEFAANKVAVIGEVRKPGSYPLTQARRSLLEILAEAGGRSSNAGGTLMLIPAKNLKEQSEFRPTELEMEQSLVDYSKGFYELIFTKLSTPPEVNIDKRSAISISFSRLVSTDPNSSLDLPLIAGDTIIVPEAGMVHVDGEVLKPGIYPLASKTTLLGAVAAAGGLRYAAAIEEVEIIRSLSDGRKALLQVNLEDIAFDKGKDVDLQNGDVVRIPSSRLRFAADQVVEAINGLVNFGVSGGVR